MTRRARTFLEHRVARENREPYDRILIVCEGAKTEPNYLEDIRRELRLATANIEVCRGEGRSPGTIVKYALERFDEDDEFDRVYCVFDRDEHADYEASVERCRQLRKMNKNAKHCLFTAITSNPCFEYWLILHFEDTSRPFVRKGKKSPGDCAVSHLKKYIAKYDKGERGIHGLVRNHQATAIARAKRVNQLNLENPHTKMNELVSALEELKQKSQQKS